MTGVGRAAGAATIVNAMATGRGVAFGLDLKVVVRVEAARSWSVIDGGRRTPPQQARLAIESAKQVAAAPLRIRVESEIPPRRGLKSSSAVSVATIRAALDHHGRTWTPKRILDAAAKAGLQSKTSVTGAYDDAAACLLGGIVFTDNRRRRLLRRTRLPTGLVALLSVPATQLATHDVRRTDFSAARPLVEDALDLARAGDLRGAMLLNTCAYAPLFGHGSAFSLRALAAGAVAAGLSGKGPAEVALVRRRDAGRIQRSLPGSRIVDVRNTKVA